MPPVNPYNKYIKQYQASNVNTATPEKLMIMLFDGALQFLQKAKTAIAEKNLVERSQNIDGARKIIRELMRTIDLENGNDVSKQLFRLYNKMAMNLIKANVQRNANLIDEVIEDISNIRWGFQKAIEIQNGTTTVEDAMNEQNKKQGKNPTQETFDDGLVEPKELEEDDSSDIENIENPNKDFYVKLNVKDDIIELYDSTSNRLIETISGNELGELVQKLNMASGIFINKKV